jgi:hypothetical protein
VGEWDWGEIWHLLNFHEERFYFAYVNNDGDDDDDGGKWNGAS